MDGTTMQRMRAHITDNEGVIKTPYKDNKGYLTVGTGFKVDDEASFVAMPFQITDSQTGRPRPATESEKKAEFKRAKGLSKETLNSNAGKSPLSLSETDIRRRLDDEISARIADIKKDVGAENWDRLTPGQQTAVLDVHYANGSLDSYPKLKKGIADGDAETIGKNVDFHSGGARNWERLARNRAEAQGISLQDAKRQVESDRKAGKFEPNEKSEQTVAPQQADLSTLRPPPRPQPDAIPAQQQQQQPTATENADTPAQSETPPQSPNAAQHQEPAKPVDPDLAAIVETAGAPETNPGRAAMLKPVEKLTEQEMKDLINHAQSDYRGHRSGDPLKAHAYEKVQDWHSSVYGDAPQASDGGKPLEPRPIRAIPDQPAPHVAPDGSDLWQSTRKIGMQVAEAGARDGIDAAVKGLQRGLNILNQTTPPPERSAAYPPYTAAAPVAEDGKYGPQTDFALKHAAARVGRAKVEDAFALGRFNTFARKAEASGDVAGLDQAVHGAFGPLFRAPGDEASAKVEAGALQDVLNDLGPNAHPDWEKLKVDDWIGEKTSTAFGKVLKSRGADALTADYGRAMGLLRR